MTYFLTETTYELLGVLADRVRNVIPADIPEYVAACRAIDDEFQEDRSRIFEIYPYTVEGEPPGWRSFFFPRFRILDVAGLLEPFGDMGDFLIAQRGATEREIRGIEFGVASWCWYATVSTPRQIDPGDGSKLVEWVLPEWVILEDHGPDDEFRRSWHRNQYTNIQLFQKYVDEVDERLAFLNRWVPNWRTAELDEWEFGWRTDRSWLTTRSLA